MLLKNRNLWHLHPAVRTGSQLTLGERAADALRNGMGSWRFVFSFLVFMGIWTGINLFWLTNKGFDPYPFILLNLLLSTMAGLQAAALLIAAKRSDSIASETALHTAITTDEIKQIAGNIKTLLEQNTELTQEIKSLTEQVRLYVIGDKALT